jgi:hypothetical protein
LDLYNIITEPKVEFYNMRGWKSENKTYEIVKIQ